MTLRDVQTMIQLTPLEETFAVRQLIRLKTRKISQESLQKGLRKGARQGELIGKIHLAQRLLKRRITPKKKLPEQKNEELRAILKKLEAELRIV